MKPMPPAASIIGHLAQALPAREAGAEVSLAIAGVAADSLSQMIPGLLGGGQAQGMLNGQRERLMQQIGNDLNNTLLYVYRDLSDPGGRKKPATFAESSRARRSLQGGTGGDSRRAGGRPAPRSLAQVSVGAGLLAKTVPVTAGAN